MIPAGKDVGEYFAQKKVIIGMVVDFVGVAATFTRRRTFARLF